MASSTLCKNDATQRRRYVVRRVRTCLRKIEFDRVSWRGLAGIFPHAFECPEGVLGRLYTLLSILSLSLRMGTYLLLQSLSSLNTTVRNGIVQDRLLMKAEKEKGRCPPTSIALRPHVLTPCDHYAHRGGERSCTLFTNTIRNQATIPRRPSHHTNTKTLGFAHSSSQFSSHPFCIKASPGMLPAGSVRGRRNLTGCA